MQLSLDYFFFSPQAFCLHLLAWSLPLFAFHFPLCWLLDAQLSVIVSLSLWPLQSPQRMQITPFLPPNAYAHTRNSGWGVEEASWTCHNLMYTKAFSICFPPTATAISYNIWSDNKIFFLRRFWLGGINWGRKETARQHGLRDSTAAGKAVL